MSTILEYIDSITKLEYLVNLLDWDLKVSTPNNSMDYLIDLKSKIELELFKKKTADEYKILLEDYINSSEFETLDEANRNYLKNLLDEYLDIRKIPDDFYQKYITICSTSNKVWRIAKEKNDYELFKPYLEEVIKYTKEYYQYIAPNKNLYDAMLDQYEKGMTQDIIDNLFNELKEGIIPIIKKIKNNNEEKCSYLKKYSDSELIECAKIILEYMGFDFSSGMLGIYPHGFMTRIGIDDIRIAFKNTNDPISFVSTIVHEGGHALYEQNIRRDLRVYSNSCVERLYALHESQSLFYENILGRNINFWKPIYNKIKNILKLDLDINEFIAELNKVKYSFIRTDADELTYCLHIIIRYEIERDLFSGKIDISNLPNIWNNKMKEYLGLEVISDKEGLMQDVHWSKGSFGYFPSYLLGSIYDGMFISCVNRDLGDINILLEEGRIKEITDYLIENIYQYGGAYSSIDILNRMYKDELSVKPLLNYYSKKYL